MKFIAQKLIRRWDSYYDNPLLLSIAVNKKDLDRATQELIVPITEHFEDGFQEVLKIQLRIDLDKDL